MSAINCEKNLRKKNRGGFRIFLMTTPFLLAVLIFSYLPLAGWSYAFFDYKAGFKLLNCDFVGLKHFMSPFSNAVLQQDVFRVLKNTVAISMIGLVSSILPLIFSVFLSEIRMKKYRTAVQTLTTIPNFIGWVLVYSLAYAMFSVDGGFINNILRAINPTATGINFLASSKNVWLTMWLYSTWKNLGWSAIMYISAMTSIDEQLYEAADIDGAGRFQKIRYVTIPGLLPTFFVLLLMAVANFLNNGMDQYFVFQNPMNKEYIEVLDLYVYNKGMVGNNISFSTAIGMLKSLISVILLFSANAISRFVREESIF